MAGENQDEAKIYDRISLHSNNDNKELMCSVEEDLQNLFIIISIL